MADPIFRGYDRAALDQGIAGIDVDTGVLVGKRGRGGGRGGPWAGAAENVGAGRKFPGCFQSQANPPEPQTHSLASERALLTAVGLPLARARSFCFTSHCQCATWQPGDGDSVAG